MLKSKKSSSFINNKKGMAVFELIPIIIVIVLLINFSLGFFGAIHTGILNSIASRNYAFETFRNRSNLVYLKNTDATATKNEYSKFNIRIHATASEKMVGKEAQFVASSRLIDFASSDKRAAEIIGNEQGNHAKIQGLANGRNEAISVNPIWIKTAYGICLNADCKPK
ncbi:MAG: hypothetical protein ACXVCP_13545 [Bdellovibrio sp.]